MDGQLWMQMWLADNLVIPVPVRVTYTILSIAVMMFYFIFPLILCAADATPFSNANFGQGTVPILLDDVACTASISRLVDCPYDNNTADCTHSQDAGVRCTSRELYSCRCLDICSSLKEV